MTLQGVGLASLAHSLFVNGILSIHFSTVVSTGWRAGIDYKRAILEVRARQGGMVGPCTH